MNINLNVQMKEIFAGNLLLILCSLLYLVWWIVTFKPDMNPRNFKMLSIFLITAAFISGLIGLIFVLKGINTIPRSETIIPGKYIIIGGIIAYFALLIITSLLLRRQITTELLLIVGWAVLEFTMINVLFGSGIYSNRLAVILMVLVIIAAIISMICYVLYYRLNGRAGYIDGMIPLILVAVVMAIETFCFN